MLKFTIKPYDVLFFGSGKPFNIGDIAKSIFPPHPNTFAGAICSKIYSEKRINVSEILNAVYGPFIQKDGEVYLPKPQNIYGERKKKEIEKVFSIKPENISTKLFKEEYTNKPPDLKLPVFIGSEDIAPLDGFISINGLKKWFSNQDVDKKDILLNEDIFQEERRVGIKIDSSLYSVGGKEDAIYNVGFLRLGENVSFIFWVDFRFDNLRNANLNSDRELKEFFNAYPRVLKLGGEMRSVKYEVEENNFYDFLKEKMNIEEEIKFEKGEKITLLFLTHGVFDTLNNGIPEICDFKVYSLAFKGYEIIGINSINYGRKTKRAFPPGTVLWGKVVDETLIKNPSFIIKDNETYKIMEKGWQDFIGTNLILIKKGW